MKKEISVQYENRLNTLREIEHAILEARSTRAIAEGALNNIDQLLPLCQWGNIKLFDEESQEAISLASIPKGDNIFADDEHFSMEDFRIESDPTNFHVRLYDNLHEINEPSPEIKKLADRGVRSYLSVPLVAQSRLIGSFTVAASTPNIYSSECIDIVKEISVSLAVALENARLLEAERKRNHELMSFVLISAALRVAHTPEEIYLTVLDQLLILMESKSSLIALQDPSGDHITISLGLGGWARATGEQFPLDKDSVIREVANSGKPYIINQVNDKSKIYRLDLLGNVSAIAFVPLATQNNTFGVLGIGRQTKIAQDEIRLLKTIADMVASAIQRAKLTENLIQSHAKLTLAYDATLEGWARALELRDMETKGHTQRVTEMVVRLAVAMGIEGSELANLRRGALLHDIGKIGIPDSILLKPASLTKGEQDIMRQHPSYAYNMLSPIDFLNPAISIPYSHHEKWDGTGYPLGLKGDQIPLHARIFAVVDVYDALTSTRPYRPAWPIDKTLDYIRSQAGIHFDPEVVEVFMTII